MMIANPEALRAERGLRSRAGGRSGWLAGTALAGRIGALAAGAGAAAVALPEPAAANPTGGSVVAGSAEIVTVSPTRLDIVQSSQKAVINWGDFSIGADEATNFLQPGRNSWALNRVTGGNPSEILGALTANGNVIVLNQNGVLFGPNARIDVGGLIASTANIADEDFLADRFRFEGAPQGSTVINQGRITVAEGGLAALVAPGVANSGVIEARLGRVALAAGTAFTVDLYGDGLVSLALGGAVPERPSGPDGSELAALVTNDGRIVAEGGRVLLTAEAAAGVVDSVINMGGVIEARSVGQDATGAIVLAGGETGVVAVSGRLDASGETAGESGGRIEVTGELVHLQAGATLDASGAAGGGAILVGGDFQGGGETPTARRTLVERGVTLAADATEAGDGGRVIVWSDEATAFYGHVTATGGASAGDGGFAEISGKESLAYSGTVDLTAAAGTVGSVLFDPRNVRFLNGGPAMLTANPFFFATMADIDFTFDADAINNADADTTVQANQNIIFDEAINTGDAFSYTFQAGQGIVLNADIVTSGGAVTLIASDPSAFPFTPDPAVTQTGIAGSGNIVTNGGAISLTVSTGANPTAINLSGKLDSSNAMGDGGSVTVRHLAGSGASNAIILGDIDSSGAAGGAAGMVNIATMTGFLTTGAITASGGSAAAGSGADGGSGGGVVVTTTAGEITLGTIDATGGDGDGAGSGSGGGNVSVTTITGRVTLLDADTSGGDAGIGGDGSGGNAGSLLISTGARITLDGGADMLARLRALGGRGDGAGSGGVGGIITLRGAVDSAAASEVVLDVSGGQGGASGGNAGSVVLMNAATFGAADLTITAEGGAGTSMGGVGGGVALSGAVTANSIAINVDGGSDGGAVPAGRAGLVMAAALTANGTGANGGINISALGALGALGSGTVTASGAIDTNAADVVIDAADDITLAAVMTAASALGGDGGMVVLTSGMGDIATGAIAVAGADAAAGSDAAGGDGGDVTVTATTGSISLGAIDASGGAGDATGSGGTGGSVTLAAPSGRVMLSDLDTSGGAAAAGGGGTGGAAGDILITAGLGTTFLGGGDAEARVLAEGGTSAGAGSGGTGGDIAFTGAVGSASGVAVTISANGGAAGGTGGDAGQVTFMDLGSFNDALTVTASGGMGAIGGDGGGIAFNDAVSAALIRLEADGGVLASPPSGLAGRIVTADLAANGAGAMGGVFVSARGAVGPGMAPMAGTVTTEDIVTNGAEAVVEAADDIGIATVTTLANLPGSDAGAVTISSTFGMVTTGTIIARGTAGAAGSPDGGDGASVAIATLFGDILTGGITTSGGNAAAGSGGSGGASGMIAVTTGSGSVTLGRLTASGGTGDGIGSRGAGGDVSVAATGAATLGDVNTLGMPDGSLSVTAGMITFSAVSAGTLDANAPTVRLTSNLTFASLGSALGAPGMISVATTASIQDAIDIAGTGAQVLLDIGTFNERGILIDKHVDLVGSGKTTSVIDANPAVAGFTGRGNTMDAVTVTAGGAEAADPLALRDLTVRNAGRDGIVLDGGAGGIGFIDLIDLASNMNGDDGLSVIGGAVDRLNILGGMFISNGSDGIRIEALTMTDLLIGVGSALLDNGGSGLHVIGTAATDGGDPDQVALTIDGVDISRNGRGIGGSGILVEQMARIDGLTMTGGMLAQNREHGASVIGSQAHDARFQGVDFRANGFDALGMNGNGGDGFHAGGGAMLTNLVIAGDGSGNPTTLRDNAGSGAEINAATVMGARFDTAISAQNGADGLTLIDSDTTNLAIANSDFGRRIDMTFNFAGSMGNGVAVTGGTIDGLVIADSRFDGNGTGGAGSGFRAEMADIRLDPADGVEDASFSGNRDHGFAVIGGTLANAHFVDTLLDDNGFGPGVTGPAANGGDGFHGEGAAITGLQFMTSSLSGNGGDGVGITSGALDGLLFVEGQVRNQVRGNQLGGIAVNSDLSGVFRFAGIDIVDNLGGAGVALGDTDTASIVSALDFSGANVDQNAGDGVRLDGLVAEGVSALDSSFQRNQGAGFRLAGGMVGSISAFASSPSLIIMDSDFSDNGLGGAGSGFQVEGGAVINGLEASGITHFDRNRDHGFALVASTLNDAELEGATFNNNGAGGPLGLGDGVHIEASVVNRLAILGSGGRTFLNANQGSGIGIADSAVAGLTLGQAQILGNGADGILGQGMTTLTDLQIMDSEVNFNLGSGMRLMDVALVGALIADSSFDSNGAHGVAVIGGSFADATFTNGSLFNNGLPMGGDGFHGENAAISNLVFDVRAGGVLQAVQNNGNGISIVGGSLDGLAVRGANVSGNMGAGVLADSDLQGDIAIGSSDVFTDIIGNLGGAGLDLGDRNAMTPVANLSIDSALFLRNAGHGAVLRGLGVGTLAVADSGFAQNMGDGLSIMGGTFTATDIAGTTVALNMGDGLNATGAMFGNGGFALMNSEILANGGDGVEFNGVVAADLTIDATTIGENMGHGLFVDSSTIDGGSFTGNFFNLNGLGQGGGSGIAVINGSTVRNAVLTGNQITGNTLAGIDVTMSTLDGVTIASGEISHNEAGGVHANASTLTNLAFGAVFVSDNLGGAGVTVTNGTVNALAFMGALIQNNVGGVAITGTLIDDVAFDGGTTVANNGAVGIGIMAVGLDGTDGSILFGNTAITDNMTGILVHNADAQASLLLTFGPTAVNGGTDALVLSGAGLGLAGGGGMIPGGSAVGGGLMPGDGLFGGSLGGLSFSGQTGTFVTLANGALFDPGGPTVIDASGVTFEGVAASELSLLQRRDVLQRIVDFNDDPTLGLILLPMVAPPTLPRPAENPGLIGGLPANDENTPGDTLHLIGELEFNPDSAQPNAFCFRYSLAENREPAGVDPDQDVAVAVCKDPPATPFPSPNDGLGDFWRGWQAARR